ncbi:MAG: hypothetical protein DRH70_01250 [Candidatus Coatesbacteria bacterium]|nr:MAG: hypothetical protein DRH70_01250 [Candidatus Coatesbacteria bacterium]
MQIFERIEGWPKHADPLVVAIGNFDGVHIGHQALLRSVVETASRLGAVPGAITFVPHPLKVLLANPDIKLLTTLKERAALIAQSGIEMLFRFKFDRSLANTSARDFVTGILHGRLHIAGLVVGPRYALGRDREGNIDFLREVGAELGIEILQVPPQQVDGIVASSTKIRECLLNGEIGLANRLLGRPYSITGTVGRCAGRGLGLGFPTANILGVEVLLPQNGVYITQSQIGERILNSVTNIGHHPTFYSETTSVESHMLDYRADLYGKVVKTAFLRRIRPEHRFPSREELIRQICSDIDFARDFFRLRHKAPGRVSRLP